MLLGKTLRRLPNGIIEKTTNCRRFQTSYICVGSTVIASVRIIYHHIVCAQHFRRNKYTQMNKSQFHY